jgi:hypothetical protein
MRRDRELVPLLVALVALTGCADEIASRNCAYASLAGIVVELEDSISGARYPFNNAVATAREGAFTDSVRYLSITGDPHSPTRLALAFDREGTYTATATADGYRPWTMSGVRVFKESGFCGRVITRQLTARLQPSSGQ